MYSIETTLAIVDMQIGYVPSEGCELYMRKRSELISNILKLTNYTLGLGGRILLINTISHGCMIPELIHLEENKNVVLLTKWYNSLLHFDQVPRFHQIKNSSTIKVALRGRILQIVGVNASWCILETAKSALFLKKNNPQYEANIIVPFEATMNIPYQENLSDDVQLLAINNGDSIRSDYDNFASSGILLGKSIFEV